MINFELSFYIFDYIMITLVIISSTHYKTSVHSYSSRAFQRYKERNAGQRSSHDKERKQKAIVLTEQIFWESLFNCMSFKSFVPYFALSSRLWCLNLAFGGCSRVCSWLACIMCAYVFHVCFSQFVFRGLTHYNSSIA